MKVAITGYTGNIGRRLVKLLSGKGIEVITVGRKPDSDYQIDILNLRERIESPPFVDFIIHLAWFTKHPDFWVSPLNESFVINSVRLLKEFRKSNPLVRVIMAGSCAEIFSNSADVFELGNAKQRLRNLLLEQYEFDLTWFQIFFAFGSGEPSTKILSIIKNDRNPHEKIKNANAVRDFIHFDQIALAFEQAIFSEKKGCFQLGNGIGFSISDLMQFRLNGNLPREYKFNSSNRGQDIKIANPEKNWSTETNKYQILDWLKEKIND